MSERTNEFTACFPFVAASRQEGGTTSEKSEKTRGAGGEGGEGWWKKSVLKILTPEALGAAVR